MKRKKVWQRLACALLGTLLLPVSGLASSWGQITESLDAPKDWQQIVGESAFALGDLREVKAESGRTYNQMAYGTYPSIDGSTVAVPMAMEFARQHLGLTDLDLSGFVYFSTTHHAYENLIGRLPNGAAALVTENAVMDDGHPVDLIIATEPSDEELEMAEAAGVSLVVKPVCYDAFVFIVHKDNPVEGLTLAQIQDIYGGRITDWSEVGGTEGPIFAYQREKNSGSQTAMENLVMQGKAMRKDGTNYYFLSEMSSLVVRIGEFNPSGEAIGYTYKYYIDALYPSDTIKVLAVDGVHPTEENIRSGAYPFTTNYFGVIREGDENTTGGQFLDWMLSEEGQRCIAQAGYIPYGSQE